MLVDNITKTFSKKSQTLCFAGKSVCLKQNFPGTKKFGKALPPNAPLWLWAQGGPKLVSALSKTRRVVAFLTQNIKKFFYQGHQNSGRAGGMLQMEKLMAI